jgi:AraC family transcriptional activator of mtrCDE
MAARINVEASVMTSERPFDVLSGLAPLLRVLPELQQLCRFGAQWASDHAAEGHWAPVHFVTRGACVVELSDPGRTILLSAGDALVLPRGTAHCYWDRTH